MNINKLWLVIVVLFSMFLLSSCSKDLDRLDSNTYINEETSRIDNEYVFKVIGITESPKYIKDDVEYDSKFENGIFITVKIIVTRLTLEKSEESTISPEWFKLKKGVGFRVWNSSLGETFKANDHINAVESSFEPFIPEKGSSVEISVVFDIGEKYLNTDRVLTLEIDRPWSIAGALEVVLIDRPNKD